LWVAPNAEHYEYVPANKTSRNPWPRSPHPDVQQYSYRDYGNRQGIWRLDGLFKEFGIRPTFSVNSGMLTYYPEVAELIADSDGAVMGHGVYNTDYLHELGRADERAVLKMTVDDISRLTGKVVRGYLGPGISATVDTPDILAELGLSYQAEWVLDDQPTPILVAEGRLVSLPYTFELNDARMINDPCSAEQFADSCLRQLARLRSEGAESGRVMCIALHSFISGQPHVAPELGRVFDEIRRCDDVWIATADEIATWYLEHSYEEQLRFALAQPVKGSPASTPRRIEDRHRAGGRGQRPGVAVSSTFRQFDYPYLVESAANATGAGGTWPDEKSLAASFVVWLDYLDVSPAEGSTQSSWLGGGPGTRPYPDYARYAHREYGHRVGVFRLLDILASNGFPLVVAVDSMTATEYPGLIDELNRRGVEWIAHGVAVTRMLSSRMSLEKERDYIGESLATLEEVLAVRPRGWIGPEYGESSRTPALLMDSGVEFLCDWGNDDHPYRLRADTGEIWVVPSLACYDDSFALDHRKLSTHAFYSGVLTAAETLVSEAAKSGPRSLVVNVRPWLTGQPFRATYFAETTEALSRLEGIWRTSPGAMISHLKATGGDNAAS